MCMVIRSSVFSCFVTLLFFSKLSLVVFYSATLVMEERRHVFTTVKDYVKQAIRKANAAGGQYHDGNVGVIVANVPRQRPGTLDCGAFVIYYAFKILMVRFN
jgi:Ulp1 family protease